MFDLAASVGAESIRVLWVPLVAWTVLWALAEGALLWLRDVHPGIRYRLTQTVLWTLPLGLALAAWMPTHWLPSEWALSHWIPIQAQEPSGALILLASPLTDAVELASPLSRGGPNLVLVGLGLGAGLVAVVALVSLARLGMQSVAVVQLRRAIPRMSDPTFDRTAQRIALSLGVEGAADIVLTKAELVPMTLGIRRPLVVIPATLSAADRRSALLHELVHVRERDPLAQAAEALVSALFAAHPAAHRLARTCDLLREMACDAAVLDHSDVSRRSYAALVSSFATPSAVRALPATVGMASPVFHVHHRLRAMSTSRPLPSRLATWSPALAVLLVAALFVTAGSALAQSPTPIEEIVEVPSVITVQGVLVDSLRIRAIQEGIESLSAGSNHFVRALNVEEREIPRGELRHVEERQIRARILKEELGVIREGSLRQIEGDARVLQEELEGFSSENRFVRRRAGEDSVVVGHLFRRTPDSVRLRAVKEELEAVRLRSLNRRDVVGVELVEQEIPLEAIETTGLSLGDPYPNPAQDVVVINVTVPETSTVTVGLYDVTGRRLVTRSERVRPGAHKVAIETSDLAAGTYVYRVSAKSGTQNAESTRRITIAR